MNKIKKQFTEDFYKSSDVELTFDVDKLNVNSEPTKRKIRPLKLSLIITSSVVATLLLIPLAAICISSLNVKESVKLEKKSYSLNQVKIAESNTFKKLNDISYPSNEQPITSNMQNNELIAYNNFSNLTYHSLVDTSKQNNMSYSVVGLYSSLNEMIGATSNDQLKNKLNVLLGLDDSSRESFYKKIMNANSFVDESNTIQLKNSAFFTNDYSYSQSYVDYLTNLFCEAYQIDFDVEANKIVEWVNKATNSNGFIDEKFLDMDEQTVLYLLSSLYFKNGWASKYLSNNNIKDSFYLVDGQTVSTEYMKHSYYIDRYYDYGDYISFKDYYANRYASVTYLIPKKIDDNIFDLTKDVNIFEDNNDNLVKGEEGELYTVNLTTPKFNKSCDVDFSLCLTDLGLGDMFNPMIDSFHNAFDLNQTSVVNIYLQKLKQRNEVEFNEDGSKVKSITMSSMGFLTAEMGEMISNTLDIKLNQPFIYIIKDINDTPIFVGHIDNPNN